MRPWRSPVSGPCRTTGDIRRVGEAYSQGALYRPKKPEGWFPDSGPKLKPHALYGYIGAGWVHPRFRGHNLAGFIARIAQSEALMRTRGTLSMSTAMTAEALFRSGMNLRASGLHHLHVEQVLGGYLAIADHDMKLYLSYSTGTELMSFYERELDMLREGEVIPWLHEHDKASAEEVDCRRPTSRPRRGARQHHGRPAVLSRSQGPLSSAKRRLKAAQNSRVPLIDSVTVRQPASCVACRS